MDWFLYDRDLRHEWVKGFHINDLLTKNKRRIAIVSNPNGLYIMQNDLELIINIWNGPKLKQRWQ